MVLLASSLLSNTAHGADTPAGKGETAIASGFGGGICNLGMLFATNDTLYGNSAIGGAAARWNGVLVWAAMGTGEDSLIKEEQSSSLT